MRPPRGVTAPRQLQVNGHSAGWLARGFPWVYPQELVSVPKGLRSGELVSLRGPRSEPLGQGVYDEGWIAVRRFLTTEDPLDKTSLAEKLDIALRLRSRVLPPETTAWRLLNAENDSFPGIRVDVWGPELCVRLDSPSLLPLTELLCDLLQERLAPQAIHLAWRPDPREKQRSFPPLRLLRGDPSSSPVQVSERGVGFLVEPSAGADAGLYPDMRDNRAWLDPCWRGRKVLNLFAYTSAFSVFAALRGAASAVSVDLDAGVLERARANLLLNGLDPKDHPLVAEDSFKALDSFRRKGERFDLVLADPPSHARGPSGDFTVERDLARLVAACLRVLAPEGLLVVACNDGKLSPRAFQESIQDGSKRAERRLLLLHSGGQAPDFPAAVDFPEGRYLKFQVLSA